MSSPVELLYLYITTLSDKSQTIYKELFRVRNDTKKYPALGGALFWLGVAVQAVALGVSVADLFGALVAVVVALRSVARATNRILALERYCVTFGSVFPKTTAG